MHKRKVCEPLCEGKEEMEEASMLRERQAFYSIPRSQGLLVSQRLLLTHLTLPILLTTYVSNAVKYLHNIHGGYYCTVWQPNHEEHI